VLDEELDRLPAKYRRPLVLCYLEGKTSDVAARELGWKVGTLWGRLARGRQLLRGRLARRNLALSTAGLFALVTGSAAEGALPASLTRATMAAALSPGSASVAELVKGVTLQMTLAKLRTVVGVMLAAGLLVFAGGHLLPTGEAAPAPEAKKQPGAKDEIPPYDGKLRTDGQTAMPQGGKVVLYSRNRYGNYPLASFAFHLGLRGDDARVANYVNLLFGNRIREKPFDGVAVDVVPGLDGQPGPGGNGGAGGGKGVGSDGAPGGKGFAGAAGLNGEQDGPAVDEFQVNCYGGSRQRIVDLGRVEYAKAKVPQELEALLAENEQVKAEQNLVPVHLDHVYIVHVYGSTADSPLVDLYIKLKVLQHQDNEAVQFEWAPLPPVARK
jgi:hypothetical protein